MTILRQNASSSESSSRNELVQGGANQEHPDNNHDDDTAYVMMYEDIPRGSQDNNLCETTASGELKPQSRKSTREYVD